jgi:hypothetical protein
MEKQMVRWTFLLGMVCLVIAILWRGINAVGAGFDTIELVPPLLGRAIGYMSFYKAALLFFIASIAASGYLSSQKS